MMTELSKLNAKQQQQQQQQSQHNDHVDADDDDIESAPLVNIVVNDDEIIVARKQKEYGKHLYCGYFCTMRQAVILSSFISFTLAVLFIYYLVFIYDPDNNITDTANKNDTTNTSTSSSTSTINSLTVQQEDNIIKVFKIFFIPTWLIVPFFGIYGAFKYNKYCVATHMMLYIILLFISLFDFLSGFWSHIGYVIICLLFIYPHAIFIVELRHGLITKGN